ncbi:hypothetical protein ACVGWX_07090, partial [Enterobacter hormaechei]
VSRVSVSATRYTDRTSIVGRVSVSATPHTDRTYIVGRVSVTATRNHRPHYQYSSCLVYKSDAADDNLGV